MPGKILGIDVSKNYISAVQLISGLKGYQMVSCFSEPVTGNNPEEALLKLTGSFDMKSDRCLVSIPASDISFRNIKTPFKDTKKIRQTLPFEIETHLPFSIDDMVIDYNHTHENNPSAILTAAIKKVYIAEYIQKFNNAGINPDIIDVRPVPVVIWLIDQEKTTDSGIYLDLEYENPCVVIFQNNKIVLVRELPCVLLEKADVSGSEKGVHPSPASIENFLISIFHETNRTIHSFISQAKKDFTVEKIFYGGRLSGYKDISSVMSTMFEATPQRINISGDSRLRMDSALSGIYEPSLMDNALAVSIRENKKNIGFNFRRDEFAVKRNIFGPGKDARKVAVLLSIFFIMLIINNSIDYYYLSRKHALVEDHFNKLFDNKFTEHKGIKGTQYKILILEQNLKDLKNPSADTSTGIKTDQKVLDILKDISQRIPGEYNININTMQINNREVTISANTDSYDTVDKIANILKPSDLYKSVNIINPGQSKDGIKFDLKLERAE